MISKTIEGYLYEEFIFCYCGCKLTRSKHDKKGRLRYYIEHHQHKGKRLGENNGAWKGDEVSKRMLHDYLRTHNPPPEFCEFCNKVPPDHLACITGVYNRDFKKNYKYLCVLCHNRYDQREKMKEVRKRKCLICGSKKTYITKYGHPQWYKYGNDGYICNTCHLRQRRYRPH